MKLFHARGFLKNEKVASRYMAHQYDGKKLDELSLTATMTSREDVDNVIEYLKIHRFCFEHYVASAENEPK